MLDRLKDVGQTAVSTGERALRMLWDILSVATERLRSPVDEHPSPSREAPPRSATPPASQQPAPRPAARPSAGPRRFAQEAAKPKKSKAKTARAGKPAAKGSQRPDQLLRVLEILDGSGGKWMSAKEISDAGELAQTPILPGNVRKVVRGRGDTVIETRPRPGSRRGALEYRITEAGRKKLKG